MLENEIELRKYLFQGYDKLLRSRNLSPEQISPNDPFVATKIARNYTEERFQRIKSPFKDYYSKIFLKSKVLSDVIDKLMQYKVLNENDINSICWSCGDIYPQKEIIKCRKCSNKMTIFPFYMLPENIMGYWLSQSQRFIEGLCYNSIKKANLDIVNKIEASTDVLRLGKKWQTATEMDVTVIFKSKFKMLNDDNSLVILCTTNPQLPSEKKQAKFWVKNKKSFVLVTTSQLRIQGSIENFTRIDEDSDFPRNLIKFLREIN
jgi:hypothetical protein